MNSRSSHIERPDFLRRVIHFTPKLGKCSGPQPWLYIRIAWGDFVNPDAQANLWGCAPASVFYKAPLGGVQYAGEVRTDGRKGRALEWGSTNDSCDLAQDHPCVPFLQSQKIPSWLYNLSSVSCVVTD